MNKLTFSKYVLFTQLLLTSLVFVFQIVWFSNIFTLILLFLNVSAMLYLYKTNNKLLRGLAILVVMMCISSISSWALSPKYQMGAAGLYSTSHIMTGTIKNLTTFFLVYNLSQRNIIKSSTIFRVGIILLVITLFGYFVERSTLDYSKFGRANNVAYTLICVSLLVMSSSKLKRDYFLLVGLVFLVVLGAKRGAILSLVVVITCYIYYRYFKKGGKKILLIPIIVASFYYIGNYIYSTDENLQLKAEATAAGDTSGREYINEILWVHWLNSSTKDQIFGYQFAGSVGLLEMDSHNDWLELLTGQGVIGVVLYAFILLYWFRLYLTNREYLTNNEKFVITGGLLMWVLKSTVSQTLYGEDAFIFIIALGYLLGQSNLRKLQKNEI